jgi:hypothetical protein
VFWRVVSRLTFSDLVVESTQDGVSELNSARTSYQLIHQANKTPLRFLPILLPRQTPRISARLQRPGRLHEEFLGSLGVVQGYAVSIRRLPKTDNLFVVAKTET